MENVNRSDVIEFFEKMPQESQLKVIQSIEKNKKSPNDSCSIHLADTAGKNETHEKRRINSVRFDRRASQFGYGIT